MEELKYVKPRNGVNMDRVYDWYSRASVKFEIIKFTKAREMAVLVPSYLTKKEGKYNTRMLKCHSVQHFDVIREAVKFESSRKRLNLYYTIAEYNHTNGIPNQTLKFSERDNREWTQNHHKYVNGYDFFLDIDAGSFEDVKWAYRSADEIRCFLNHLNVPYHLRFSGKGFHFIVPYRFFSGLGLSHDAHDDGSILKLYSSICNFISEKFSEMVDRGIYDSRRLCKIPYSISLYEDDAFVCTPFLSKEEFREFNFEDYRLDTYAFDVMKRGSYLFNEDGNVDGLLSELGKYHEAQEVGEDG